MLLIETGMLYLSWQILVAIISYLSSSCDGRTQSCIAVQFSSNAFAESTTIVAVSLRLAIPLHRIYFRRSGAVSDLDIGDRCFEEVDSRQLWSTSQHVCRLLLSCILTIDEVDEVERRNRTAGNDDPIFASGWAAVHL